MPATYKNSPIIEALCELRFTDVTVSPESIENFYNKIKEHFPVKKKPSTQTFEFIVDTQIADGQKMQRSAKDFDQFLSEDGLYLINLLDGRISIHRLKPYISWQDFLPKISLVIKSYLEIFKPKGLERAGIRYVNNMAYPAKNFEFNSYFAVGLSFPEVKGMGSSTSQFIGNALLFNEGKDQLKIQLGEIPSNNPEIKTYVFDADYYSLVKFENLTLEELEDWIVEGHQTLEDVFESVMTQASKDLFK